MYPYSQGDKVLATEYNEVVKASGIYAADSGSTDSYAITVLPIPSAYLTGMVFRFKANTINTGAASLNVNSLGAKTIKKEVSLDLSNGDIKAGQLVEVIYDGTNFQLLSATQPRPLYGTGQSSRTSGSGIGTQNIAHGLGVTPRLIKIFFAQANGNNNSFPTGVGTATSTSDSSCTVNYSSNDTTAVAQAAKIIQVYSDSYGDYGAATVSAIDQTNITLNWTTAPVNTIYFQWEACA